MGVGENIACHNLIRSVILVLNEENGRFQNLFSAVSVYAELKNQRVSSFCGIYGSAVGLSAIFYVLVSYFSISTFGTSIPENFIVSL